jgi:hypothetical protein
MKYAPRMHHVVLGQVVTACGIDATIAKVTIHGTNAIAAVNCGRCRVRMGWLAVPRGWRRRFVREGVQA